MTNFLSPTALLLVCGLTFASSCQSNSETSSVAADLNSPNPAVSMQAQRVQQLEGEVKQQEAVIDAEKSKLEAMRQQLEGAKQTLEGVKKEAQAAR